MKVLRKQGRILKGFLIASLTMTSNAFSAELEEIVVTARATEESVREVPVAITAVSEERMDRYGIEGFMDLEAMTPQLTIGRGGSGSGASIGIRGIASTSSSIGIEQSVSVIIDGTYMPQGRAINEGLFDVGQVAVLKGPQALYFGKNATAGVITLTTNDPTEEFEASIRVNNEFESDDLTVEGIINIPLNDNHGMRFAIQKSDMDKGWILNNAGADEYGTFDANTGAINVWENPEAAGKWWPGEETLYMRMTLAGDLTDRLAYNLKASYADYRQNASSGGGELYSCPTLNGVGHNSQPVDPQPPGWGGPGEVVLLEPIPVPAVDCVYDGQRGINDVPPGIAAGNDLLNQFGDGDLGEKFTSYNFTLRLDYAADNFDVSTNINYQEAKERWVSDFDGGGVTSIFAGEQNTFDQFAIESKAVTNFDSPLNFVAGVYWQKTDRWFDQDVIFAFLPFAGCPGSGACGPQVSGAGMPPDTNDQFTAYNKLSETDGETWSVYAEAIWDITDDLQLTTGLRYLKETKDSWFHQPFVNPFVTGLFIMYDPADPTTEAVDDASYKNLIPEATLRWMPRDNLTIYAAYKEGFKSGGFSNSAILSNLSPPIADSTRPGGLYFSDFIFEPEQNRGGEIGVKALLFDASLSVDFEVFFYQFKDLQVDFFNSAQFAFVTSNGGGSQTYGAEVQVDWATPIEGLTLSGSFGWLESVYTKFEDFCYGGQTPANGCGPLLPGQTQADLRQQLDGNTRPGAPRWSGHFAFSWERPVGNNLVFGFNGNLQYKSLTHISSSNYAATYPSYATVDANITLGTSDGRWTLALIGKNLTDKLAIRGGGGAVPSTSGNTGTDEGFLGDFSGGAIRPRQVELELLWRL